MNKIFPIYFSYCFFELAKFIGFVWKVLKFKIFIPNEVLSPYIVLGDWADNLIKLVSLVFPDAYFQGYN